jgi:hypothetical protein
MIQSNLNQSIPTFLVRIIMAFSNESVGRFRRNM